MAFVEAGHLLASTIAAVGTLSASARHVQTCFLHSHDNCSKNLCLIVSRATDLSGQELFLLHYSR